MIKAQVKERQNYHVTLLRTPIVFFKASINVSTLTMPLALAYLSASLKKSGFPVAIIDSIGEAVDHIGKVSSTSDLEYQGLSTEEILKRVDPKTDLLGVSCMFSSEWTHTRSIIKTIKKQYPQIPIIVGGEHATAVPEIVLGECPEIDLVVLGEGEETIIHLADCLRNGNDLEEVKGIFFRKNGALVKTPPSPRIKKIDTISWPDWENTPIHNYLDARAARGTLNVRTIPMLASRGCPYECTFCSNPVMYGRYYATRSPEDLLDEIALYIDKYKLECVDFFDLTTITKRSWILRFCELIIQRNMKFAWRITGGARTEAIDEEVIIKAKQAGCEYLGFAPESGSEVVIDSIKKRVDLKRMYNLFKLAIKHGLATRANFIIGFPRETRLQIYETLMLQIKLAFVGVLDSPIFAFVPYPGSEEFNYLIGKKVLTIDDEYFDSLSTNLSFSKKSCYSENVSPFELYFYRMAGLFLYYFIYYLIRPVKLFGFVKSFFGNKVFNSIFEQRVLENFDKFKQMLLQKKNFN